MKRTITLDGKDLPIKWTNKSSFRMSAMGFGQYDPDKGMAYLSAMIAAAIDTPKQVFTAEQVFEHLCLLDDEDAMQSIIEEVLACFEDSQSGKPSKKKAAKRGRSSGSK